MLIACEVKPDKKQIIPAVVHVDDSCRVQTVKESNNREFYKLLKEFHKITNCPVLLNTSFNVKGQPIVNTPKQAVDCFLATNIDVLVIGEVHFKKMKELIDSKVLGKIYSCRMFYGNGTATLVKRSNWRDKNFGIIADLGSHLIDTCLFWFGKKVKDFKLVSSRRFENKSPDHAIILLEINKIKIELEMSLCMWKNTFTCDVIASRGSAHLNSFPSLLLESISTVSMDSLFEDSLP